MATVTVLPFAPTQFSADEAVHALVSAEGSEGSGCGSDGDGAPRARVYYNARWVPPALLPRLLTAVPVMHGRRGACITLLPSTAVTSLLLPDERVLARRKVVAAWCWVYARGGYGPYTRQLQPQPARCLVLHAPIIDWDVPMLDAGRFFVLHDMHPRLARIRNRRSLLRLPNGLLLDEASYTACIAEDVSLALHAAEAEAAARGVQLWVKLPPLGVGPSVHLWDGTRLGPALYRGFMAGVGAALEGGAWPHIAVLELVDLTPGGALTPRHWPETLGGVRIITGLRRDLLDFDGADASLQPAVVCPGDAFAWPGNEWTDTSLNAMVGNNTSLRRVGCAQHNPALLDAAHHMAVHVSQAVLPPWWPPKEWTAPMAAPAAAAYAAHNEGCT